MYLSAVQKKCTTKGHRQLVSNIPQTEWFLQKELENLIIPSGIVLESTNLYAATHLNGQSVIEHLYYAKKSNKESLHLLWLERCISRQIQTLALAP